MYSLVPCGHIACHACLVRWFGSSEQDQNNDEENPDIEWLSDEESEPEGDGPRPAADPSDPPEHDTNGHSDGTHTHTPDPIPAHQPFPNFEERIKTCPHCRCRIVQRPVPAYAIRDILGILGTGAAIPDTKTEAKKRKGSDKKTPKKDPWQGVFPPDHDHYGGGGGGGGGGPSGNGGPSGGLLPRVPTDTTATLEPIRPSFLSSWASTFVLPPLHVPPSLPPRHGLPPILPPPHHDEEDGVQRCGVCLHELWHGTCTNTNCNVEYAHALAAAVAEEEEEEEEVNDREIAFLSMRGRHGAAGDPEDEYESSFIDDDEDLLAPQPRGPRSFRSVADAGGCCVRSNDDEDEDDDFLPGPSRRHGRGRDEPIVISSDEGEEEIPLPRRLLHGRGRSRQIVDDEEDEGEERDVRSELRYDERLFF